MEVQVDEISKDMDGFLKEKNECMRLIYLPFRTCDKKALCFFSHARHEGFKA